MLSPADNVRLTQVGPGTPGGALMRRYWQPFALSTEVPENDGAPIRVCLLGEDLRRVPRYQRHRRSRRRPLSAPPARQDVMKTALI